MKKVLKNIGNRVFSSVSRALNGPKARFSTSLASSIGLNLAGGAGAGGVLLGKGENLIQKVGDAVTAIPKGISSVVNHYLNAPEYVRQTDAALQYLREQGPGVAGELSRAGRYLEAGARQADRGMGLLADAKDYLLPGGDLPFDPQNAYHSLREGIGQLDTAVESIYTGKDQAMETAGPAIDALKQVDINPVLEALHNFADNVAPDEIGSTLGVAATSILGAYAASQYVRGFWGRRGRPGILARFIQRKGIKKFRDYYTKHPERMAGEVAVDVVKDHLARNPGKLEELAQRAGYDLVQKS